MTKKDIFCATVIVIIGALLLLVPILGIKEGLRFPLKGNAEGLFSTEPLSLDEIYIPRNDNVPPFVINNKLAERIVHCESGGNPKICNNEIHCERGMGLFGIISNTWNSTLIKMAKADEFMPEHCWEIVYLSQIELFEEYRNEAIFDPVCNSMVGLWLLEHEGVEHWGYEGAEWGSYECWKNYVK